MSLYEGIHHNAGTDTKSGFEYILVYSACFALYLIPIAIRHVGGRARRATEFPASVFSETRALAANCAASSFVGM